MNKGMTAWIPSAVAGLLCATTLVLIGRQTLGPPLSQVNAAPKSDGVTSDPRSLRRTAMFEAEWSDAQDFLRKNAPNFLKAIQTVLDSSVPPPRKFRLKAAAINRVQTLKRLSERFPELYAIRIDQLRLFDNLFETHQRFVSAKGEEKEKLKEQMKQQIAGLIDNSMKDKQSRIEHLQELLVELKERAEKENQNRESLVKNHLDTVLESGVDLSLLDGLNQNESDGAVRGAVGPRGPRSESRPLHRPTTEPVE